MENYIVFLQHSGRKISVNGGQSRSLQVTMWNHGTLHKNCLFHPSSIKIARVMSDGIVYTKFVSSDLRH